MHLFKHYWGDEMRREGDIPRENNPYIPSSKCPCLRVGGQKKGGKGKWREEEIGGEEGRARATWGGMPKAVKLTMVPYSLWFLLSSPLFSANHFLLRLPCFSLLFLPHTLFITISSPPLFTFISDPYHSIYFPLLGSFLVFTFHFFCLLSSTSRSPLSFLVHSSGWMVCSTKNRFTLYSIACCKVHKGALEFDVVVSSLI